MDWTVLDQATGGCLKPDKCQVYFQTYKFVQEELKMTKLKELFPPICPVVINVEGMLAPAHIRIPQPDGSTTLIPTLDIDESAKSVGVYFNVMGGGTNNLSNMREKGMMWINKLGTKLLTTEDVRMSVS